MRKLKLTLAYDGTDFHGWQMQPDLPTIQGELERVLSEMEGKAVTVDGSGRTDAGVHALAQVASCSLENPIPLLNLRRAMNRLLPPAIRILQAEEAPPDFHARFSAQSKLYEYRLWHGEICPPMLHRYVCHHPYPLDLAAMAQAAPLFEGTRDFRSLAAADDGEAEEPAVRSIFLSRLETEGDLVRYRVRGSGFLRHMVRNIVGTLLEIGKGNRAPADVPQILESGDRRQAGPTAAARGLFLIQVDY
ncbi:MAG TPA: tRNA pseudouridine(38-40) synthase TruA [Bryobacterales bacterium]|nr:tRNA pseudouridine(38-40) synthase TruA [Bryobacterales bacterium]